MSSQTNMRHFHQRVAARLRTLDLLPQYFTAAAGRVQDILWGASLPAMIWGLWFIVSTPPTWVNWVAVFSALFMAGYYVWRADHLRLVPKFEIRKWFIQHTPTTDGTGKPTGSSIFIQLVPRCLTEVEIDKCQAHLLRVWRWSFENSWEPTEMNEPVLLAWSHGDESHSPITLYPGIDRRLNVCFLDTRDHLLYPCIHPLPLRASETFSTMRVPINAFRFDIKVTAENCKAVDVSLKIQSSGDPFNPSVEMAQSGEENTLQCAIALKLKGE